MICNILYIIRNNICDTVYPIYIYIYIADIANMITA